MTDHVYYVLHSPYPDKSWRGVEKCVTTLGAPHLFETPEDAKKFTVDHSLTEFTIVEVVLTTPGVREKL